MKDLKFYTLIGIIILIFVGFFILLLHSNTSSSQQSESSSKPAIDVKTTMQNTSYFSQNQALDAKYAAQVNHLIEFPKGQPVFMGVITNVAGLRQKFSYFARADNGDFLYIFPDETIVYDPKIQVVKDVAKAQVVPASFWENQGK